MWFDEVGWSSIGPAFSVPREVRFVYGCTLPSEDALDSPSSEFLAFFRFLIVFSLPGLFSLVTVRWFSSASVPSLMVSRRFESG